MLKKYESIFILDIRKVDDDGTIFTNELKQLIEEELKGKFIEAKPMGRKQFAREIKKRKAGLYWNYIFEVEAEKTKAIKDHFRLNDKVLRTMILNYEKPEEN